MNSTKKTRSRKPSSSSSPSLQVFSRDTLRRLLASRNPVLLQFINEVTNYKCLHVIHNGKMPAGSIPVSTTPVRYVPRVDIINDPSIERVIALFELPGMKSNEIGIQIYEGDLRISGTRHPPTLDSLRGEDDAVAKSAKPDGEDVEMQGESPLPARPIQELRYGLFQRAIRLPVGTKQSDIVATFDDGILKVTWPRGTPPPPPTTSIPIESTTTSPATV